MFEKLNKHKKTTCHCQVIYPVLVDLRGMPVQTCGLSHLARVVMLNAKAFTVPILNLSVVGLVLFNGGRIFRWVGFKKKKV